MLGGRAKNGRYAYSRNREIRENPLTLGRKINSRMYNLQIPHTKSTTWLESVVPLMGTDTCGLSFRSAFFKPAPLLEKDPWTPESQQRTQIYSRVSGTSV